MRWDKFEPRRRTVVCGAAGELTDETSEDRRRRPQVNPTPSVKVSGPTRSRGNVFWAVISEFRGVAQFGRALRSGRRGPRFKSGRPDFEFRRLSGLEPEVQPRR